MSFSTPVTADWIEWAKFGATALAPFIALGGAVWLFFLKQKADRADSARRDKRELYARFLSASNEAWNEIINGPSSNGAGALIVRSGALANEIRLVADWSVYEKATTLRLALSAFWADVCTITRDEWVSRDGAFAQKKSQHISTIAKAEIDLIDAMRNDLGLAGAIQKSGRANNS